MVIVGIEYQETTWLLYKTSKKGWYRECININQILFHGQSLEILYCNFFLEDYGFSYKIFLFRILA